MSARRGVAAICLAAVLSAAPAVGVQPGEELADPALEARARALGSELRCMVCQNQSIDDSDAPLAKDLRLLVRDRLKAGDSDEAVLGYLTERYGDFVLLRPRFRIDTVLLWLLAPGILAAGLIGYAVWAFRARGRLAEPEALTDDERARIERLDGV